MKNFISALAVTLSMSGASCACWTHPTTDQKMQTLADELRKLTAAVQGDVIADPDGTKGLSDRDLLARATAHDPSLLAPFAGYSVRVNREADYVAILVCSQDGKRGLLEDTNCTVTLDRPLWRDSPDAACQPSVSLAEACKIK